MIANARSLKPIPLPLALLYFGIPVLTLVLSGYFLILFFIDWGFTEFMNFNQSLVYIPDIRMM